MDLTVTNLIQKVEDLKLFHYELDETLGIPLAQLIVVTKLGHKAYHDFASLEFTKTVKNICIEVRIYKLNMDFNTLYYDDIGPPKYSFKHLHTFRGRLNLKKRQNLLQGRGLLKECGCCKT